MSYTRETVERLLPAIWITDYLVGLQPVGAPDPDMPRAAVDPSHGNNLPAFLVDIHRGWTQTPLSDNERRAVFLRFGFDMKQDEISQVEATSQSRISTRLFTAVGKISAQMNGTEFTEEESE